MRMRNAVMKLLLSQPFYGSLAAAISLRESAKAQKMRMTFVPFPGA